MYKYRSEPTPTSKFFSDWIIGFDAMIYNCRCTHLIYAFIGVSTEQFIFIHAHIKGSLNWYTIYKFVLRLVVSSFFVWYYRGQW